MKRSSRDLTPRKISRLLADSGATFLLGPAGRLLARIEVSLGVDRVRKAEHLLTLIPQLRRKAAGLKLWGRDVVEQGLVRMEEALGRWLRTSKRGRALRIRGPAAAVCLAVLGYNGISNLKGRR